MHDTKVGSCNWLDVLLTRVTVNLDDGFVACIPRGACVVGGSTFFYSSIYASWAYLNRSVYVLRSRAWKYLQAGIMV